MVTANGSSNNNNVHLLTTERGWRTYRVREQTFEVENRYTLTSVVGYGAYGVVCSAFDNTNFRDVAIKRVGHVFEDLIDGRRIWREIVIHRLLREHRCRNILNLTRILPPRQRISSFRDLYIVTDLYDTDLHSAIHATKTVDIKALQRIMVRVLRCIADMHFMGIIHRDLKPSNILLNDDAENENAVVCDFGLARAGVLDLQEPVDLTDYVVTRWYRPPELLLMCRYSLPIDLWAIGCIICEFVLKRPLFGGRDYIHQMQLVVSSVAVTNWDFARGSCPGTTTFMNEIVRKYQGRRPISSVMSTMPREGIDLVTKLLAFDPNTRITAAEALRHPFFSDVGAEGESKCTIPEKVDFSFDLHAEISEAQLRRNIWKEIQHYQ
ncbi:mitogen-activated protein kinase 5 [Trypanosoma equiperdum]|uniref:Mitogen-activated protein kinase 5, putative n=3 Tax=Trypanozoon TaxID=39700 RepID=Q586Y9_TRYB2|nr:mitogen-activated protein kinase 5 [Trypanosoma brucei gambiense DAL972]XP_845540.1 mitogen-activated protein kinase 5, putative [Trypanosoma brucei brucei TREU927]AAX79288.1 mitogen-activated protein kinase 5, putative [Trypanosoma brucei]SCU65314.1 mitogen-activated protein kinase 5 [Trypanosoma equiperdum]AAZ11981.1 mitogen-activated protein kinase 5, putative [Trypanosoma brucei brucei TREU927]CBH11924.1 mitogen-activated protein kinase 5 [Trypanosoma brucei gambiense DAL972]|eukprot:XP_011774209.1 mitogen-activated protein kinase 5 [Trypanosoma brucei gambiense DAL972]